MLYFFVLIFT